MNRRADNELLDDVFAENAPADFREAMLGETLRLIRRRRRFRRTQNAAGIFVALALLGIFLLQKNLSRPPVAIAPVAKAIGKNYQLVRTQPLPARDIVTTRPLTAGDFIASAATVKMVQTTTGNYRVINDKELLALVAAHPAILIRTGAQSEKLVFANPADENGFPMN